MAVIPHPRVVQTRGCTTRITIPVPSCHTAQPLAPGVPLSLRTQGGVTGLVFPQGSRLSRAVPAGCHLMAPVSQRYRGTWGWPQHPQVPFPVGVSPGWQQSRVPGCLQPEQGYFPGPEVLLSMMSNLPFLLDVPCIVLLTPLRPLPSCWGLDRCGFLVMLPWRPAWLW